MKNKETHHIISQPTSIKKQDRQQLNKQKSFILWFTGLSGSGKSTIANALEMDLYERGLLTYLLDGDNIRFGLNKDLGFSPIDRAENIRRISEVTRLFVDAGIIAITAFISPFQLDRELARKLVSPEEFIEVYVKCPLEECEKRDPKGLYLKARRGDIPDFTGITSPYEEPQHSEITIDSTQFSIGDSVNLVIRYLKEKKLID
jgi:adenylylsulfate kinase